MIQRDGACTSLWQDTTDGRTPFYRSGKISANDRFDVVIVGGGITGLTTAVLLQEAGLKCVVLEAETLCFGTTGGTTAHLNTLLDTPYPTIIKNFGHDDAAVVASSVKAAISLVETNIKKYGIDAAYEKTTAYLFAQTDDQIKELEGIKDASVQLGVNVEYTSGMPAQIQSKKILAIHDQAKFHPTRYVFGLARAFQQLGGRIIEHCRVTGADNADTVKVQTSQKDITTNILIYATHIPPGINILDTRCAPYRTYAMAVELEGDYPEGLIYDMYDPYHYYRTQVIDGKSYFIAGGEDHKTGHEENTEVRFLHLESHIRGHFPVKKIAYKWSSQYFEPADGIPYIGHLPGAPGNILVATGFGGNGMVYSAVAALTLKEIILKEPERYAAVFNPNRIKPIAGFQNFVKENVDVAKKWMGKLLPSDKLESLSDMAHGEGRVVKFEGETIAVYKDDAGQVRALAPTCSHMGCQVTWNGAERSWDCPCHGARYAVDGTVVTGPATKDLTFISLEELAEH